MHPATPQKQQVISPVISIGTAVFVKCLSDEIVPPPSEAMHEVLSFSFKTYNYIKYSQE